MNVSVENIKKVLVKLMALGRNNHHNEKKYQFLVIVLGKASLGFIMKRTYQ